LALADRFARRRREDAPEVFFCAEQLILKALVLNDFRRIV
jgi:hypothetical protein